VTASGSKIFLIGGGWDSEAGASLYADVLDAAPAVTPRVACVVLEEGDGEEYFERYAAALGSAGDCDPVPIMVSLGSTFDPASLTGADALLVCGGPSPAYAAALRQARDAIRGWLADGSRPYVGFSAGAVIAAERAIVGGWRLDGVPVCPEDAGEDLDEIEVIDGLGLVPFTVDVHCAQWGTLPRLVSVVQHRMAESGIALDENTMLTLDGGHPTVSGLGHAWEVSQVEHGVRVRALRQARAASV
jgi:cyanophycinase